VIVLGISGAQVIAALGGASTKVNAQVQWFCSLAIDEGVLTPELCRELFSRVGDNAELLVFGQQVMDLHLTDDLDKFHTMMSEAYTRTKGGDPPPALNLDIAPSATPTVAAAAPAAASADAVKEPAVEMPDAGISLASSDAEFNWNRLPSLSGVEAMSGNAVIKLMANLLAGVRDLGVSDLRISPGSKPCVICNREMRFFGDCILTSSAAAKLNTILLTPQLKERFDESQEVNYAMSLADDKRIRVNLMQQHHGIIGTYHFVPTSILSLQELGFVHEKVIGRLLDYQHGLILVSGRSGHGKTSTLAAMIDIVNARQRAFISCIEDPIEIVHAPKHSIISQREIGVDSLTYKTAITAAMRMCADLITIGDLRDLESLRLAFKAAEAGHLVIGTVNTGDVESTLNFLREAVPSPNQREVRERIADVICGIVCQQLVPLQAGGLVLATEILVNNEQTSQLIQQGQSEELHTVMEAGNAQGMHSMGQSIYALYENELISAESALANLRDKELIKRIVAQQFDEAIAVFDADKN
jgi:twitching motility protein PilT